jgi:hypothetical protein
MVIELTNWLEIQSRMQAGDGEPVDAIRLQALLGLLTFNEPHGFDPDLSELVLGDRVVLWVENGMRAAQAVNIANFVWGLNVLPKPIGSGWLLWNLENLQTALGESIPCVALVRAVESLMATLCGSEPGWLVKLRRGAAIRRARPATVRPDLPEI